MKDKRQRLAMAWPYGIPDPHLYAYLAAAAATYPYAMPNATNPVNYYNTVGLSRTPTALNQMPYTGPIRTRTELFSGVSNSFMRPSSLPVSHSMQPPPSIGCNLHTSGLDNAASLMNHPHSHSAASTTDNCNCSPLMNGVSPFPASPPMSHATSQVSSQTSQAPKAHSNTTPQGLFRPFQADIDRS